MSLPSIVATIFHTTTKKGNSPSDQVLSKIGTAQAVVLPNKLSVFVWNVHKQYKKNFLRDFKSLATGKDLILLQEYLGTQEMHMHDLMVVDTKMQFDIATSFYYHDHPQQPPQGDIIRTGVTTGSIASPLRVKALITNDVEPIVHTPKATIITEYALLNDTELTLLVVNIHGRNRGGLDPFVQQLSSLSQIFGSHKGPILLAGDFNTNSREKTRWLLEFIEKYNFKQVDFQPDDRTVSKISRQPLDWILFRGMTVESSTLPHTTGSDHQPLTVSFNVPATRAEATTTL